MSVEREKRIVYVQCAMVFTAFVSNIFAVKSLTFWGMHETAALVMFPLCYCMQDIVAELCNIKTLVKCILLTYALQIVVFGLAHIAGMLPGDPGTEAMAEAFSMVFSAVPIVILASFSAYLVGALSNGVVMRSLPKNKMSFKLRAFLSTIVGEFFDTWVFLAVMGISIEWSNALKVAGMKIGTEVVILPLTDFIKRRIENA